MTNDELKQAVANIVIPSNVGFNEEGKLKVQTGDGESIVEIPFDPINSPTIIQKLILDFSISVVLSDQNLWGESTDPLRLFKGDSTRVRMSNVLPRTPVGYGRAVCEVVVKIVENNKLVQQKIEENANAPQEESLIVLPGQFNKK